MYAPSDSKTSLHEMLQPHLELELVETGIAASVMNGPRRMVFCVGSVTLHRVDGLHGLLPDKKYWVNIIFLTVHSKAKGECIVGIP